MKLCFRLPITVYLEMEVLVESTICNGTPVYFKATPAKKESQSPFTILLLHNGGTDHSIWSTVAEILSEKHPLIQVDWPGYGECRGEPKEHGLADYADILSTFIKNNKLTSVVLVGNCLGSGAALEYCIREKGEGIHAMVLFNVLVPRTLSSMCRFFYHWANSPLNVFYHEVSKRLYTPKPLAGVVVKSQLKNAKLVSSETINHLKKLYTDSSNIQNLALLLGTMNKSKHLNRMKMPYYFPKTVVVWGDKNRILPLKKGEGFVNDFGPTEYRVLNGGHLVMLEQAEKSAEVILNTIERHEITDQHPQFKEMP